MSVGLGIRVLVADGVSDDEVNERTDADTGTTKDDDDVWFRDLVKKVNIKEWK